MKTTPNLDLVVDTNGLYAMSYYAAEASTELKYDKLGYIIAAFNCFFAALRTETKIPERVIFCFDGKSKTKKPRPPKPADWYEKLTCFQQTIQDAFGSDAYVLHPDHEADDTVATIACRSAAEGRDVVIMSGDKDLQQLIDDRISYYSFGKKRMVSARDVCEKWAIHQPIQVAVALAIIGDKADGINGVDKMGPGAVQKIFATLPKDASLEHVISRVASSMKSAERMSQFYESLEYTLLHLDVETDAKPVPFKPVGVIENLADTRAGDVWERCVNGLDPERAIDRVDSWEP